MSIKKNNKTGKWDIQYRFVDWKGKTHKTTKRGFRTKHDAERWLDAELKKKSGCMQMRFDQFVVTIYLVDTGQTVKREHHADQAEHDRQQNSSVPRPTPHQ